MNGVSENTKTIIKSEDKMLTLILMVIAATIIGYSIRVGQETIKRKLLSPKSEIDLLLDEVKECGEVVEIKIIGEYWESRTQLNLKSGVKIRNGNKYSGGSWQREPILYVGNVSIPLSNQQKERVHLLVDYKHAESGRQQITERLLTR